MVEETMFKNPRPKPIEPPAERRTTGRRQKALMAKPPCLRIVDMLSHPPVQANWVPFTGSEAPVAAMLLLVIGVLLLYYGSKLGKGSIAVQRSKPDTLVQAAMVLTWLLSIVVLIIFYAVVREVPRETTAEASPVTPVTFLCAAATFVAIFIYVGRAHGLKAGFVGAVIGTARRQ
jgi:hypothetical protein